MPAIPAQNGLDRANRHALLTVRPDIMPHADASGLNGVFDRVAAFPAERRFVLRKRLAIRWVRWRL